MVVSPGRAVRPPSSLTYSLLPTTAISRGAMPTDQVCLTMPVAGSRAATVFCPLTGTYRVEASAEYTGLPGRADAPPALGSGTDTGVPSVPSAATGNRVRPFVSDNHRYLPSGE